MDNGAPIDPTNQSTIPNTEHFAAPTTTQTPKKSSAGKTILIVTIILFVVFGLPIIFFLIIFSGTFSLVSNIQKELEQGNKLACTANGSKLTVYYNSNSITGTTNLGNEFDYDTDDIEKQLRGYPSIEDGLIAFGNSLVESSNGKISCELNGQDVTTLSLSDPNTPSNSAASTPGIITPPNGWAIIPSNIGTIYQGPTSNDSISIDTYDFSSAKSLQDASQIYIDSNTFVFEEDLYITEAKIGINKDINALRVYYKSIVFPSAAYIFKTDSGYHVVKFKTNDAEDLPAVEQTIFTYRESFTDNSVNSDNAPNAKSPDDTSNAEDTATDTQSI